MTFHLIYEYYAYILKSVPLYLKIFYCVKE